MIATEIKSVIAHPWFRRSIALLFLFLVALLIVKQARAINWAEVVTSMRSYRGVTLAEAAALAALSYTIYSSFDLLGRHYVGVKQVSNRSAMSTAFVSYAFNQSLGAMVGAIAFRIRMYSRLGLDALQISKIIMMSVVTNWLGYSAVAGIVFIFGLIAIPAGWEIGQRILHLLGACMLCTVVGYFALCGLSARRKVTLRNHSLQVPSLRLASMQLLVSVIHWPVEAAIIYVLLRDRVDFVTVLGALLLNAIAGVIAHIPAGLGVLEAIFVALLRNRAPTAELLAALLVFRAVYYVGPLAVATLVYARTEAKSSSAA